VTRRRLQNSVIPLNAAGRQSPFDLEPFGSLSGAYEFNPTTLTQRRPSRARANPILDGPHALNHERAHWFQYCGSTFGATLMTLARREDLLLIKDMNSRHLDTDSLDYVRSRLTRGDALLPPSGFLPDSPHPDVPRQMGNLLRSFAEALTAKKLLLDSADQWDWPAKDRGDLVADALIGADAAYRLHTGGHRPWSAALPAETYGRTRLDVSPILIHQTELTTRHMFETSALLNEWGSTMASAWGRLPAPGAMFKHLAREEEYALDDAIRGLAPRYSLCLEAALNRWASFVPQLRNASQANSVACLAPTLACCFDIAFNPPITPICRPNDSTWNAIYPPARFLAVVDAVRQTGVINDWPSSASYSAFRTRLCLAAGLGLGVIDGRSFQHERLGWEFFCNAEKEDPLLASMSYFDYLLWAMESLHIFRRQYPLHWAMPWLMLVKFEDFDNITTLTSPEFVYLNVPLYWVGENFEYEGRLSYPLALNLLVELCVLRCLKQVVTSWGTIDLTDSFPVELLRVQAFREMIMNTLVGLTGIEELNSVNIRFGPQLAGETAQESVASRDHKKARVTGALFHLFRVTRQEVESLELARLDHFLTDLRADPVRNVRSIDLSFDTYHSRPEGLWDVPEVREFLRHLQATCPFWPWYFTIDPDLTGCAGFVLMFFTSMENSRKFSDEEAYSWLVRIGESLLDEGARAGASPGDLDQMMQDVIDAWTRLVFAQLE
jgi:hypothetical protein